MLIETLYNIYKKGDTRLRKSLLLEIPFNNYKYKVNQFLIELITHNDKEFQYDILNELLTIHTLSTYNIGIDLIKILIECENVKLLELFINNGLDMQLFNNLSNKFWFKLIKNNFDIVKNLLSNRNEIILEKFINVVMCGYLSQNGLTRGYYNYDVYQFKLHEKIKYISILTQFGYTSDIISSYIGEIINNTTEHIKRCTSVKFFKSVGQGIKLDIDTINWYICRCIETGDKRGYKYFLKLSSNICQDTIELVKRKGTSHQNQLLLEKLGNCIQCVSCK